MFVTCFPSSIEQKECLQKKENAHDDAEELEEGEREASPQEGAKWAESRGTIPTEPEPEPGF